MTAIIDGTTGTVYINPDEETMAAMKQKQKEEELRVAALEQVRGVPTGTKDGKKINLYANIGNPGNLPQVLANDAEGIGLFRSEFLYLESSDYPTEDQQFEAYKQAAEALQGKTVVIRTLDIGADKKVDYFQLDPEENPAMGMRAIRICTATADLFKMTPFLHCARNMVRSPSCPEIISVWEVQRCKEILNEVRQELDEKGIAYDKDMEIGIMVETPAAAVMSEELAKEVDFFSIGSNDLTQYTLAIDRQQTQLDAFFDPHHPAVLKLIQMTIENGHKAGIWVGICGELGADLTLTETFLRMGVDELSVSPLRRSCRSIEKVRSLDLRVIKRSCRDATDLFSC